MSRSTRRMGDRGYIVFLLLFLVMLSWGQVIQAKNDGKARFDRWRVEPVWHHEEEGDVQWLGVERDGGRGAPAGPVLVAQWDRALRVLDRDGQVRGKSPVPQGTRAALGDLDDDGRDEILLGSKMELYPQTVVQVLNPALEPLGPAIPFPGVQSPAGLLALDLDGQRGRELAVVDSRGCVGTAVGSKPLWTDCFVGIEGEKPAREDAPARFLGAMRYVSVDKLVVGRTDGDIWVPLGNGKMDWVHELGEPIHSLLVEDLDHNGTGEVIVTTARGQVIEVESEGGEQWRASLGETAHVLETIDWDGNPDSLEVAVGGDQGKIVVLGDQGQPLEEWDWDYWTTPVGDLLRADLDRDGRDDLVAALGTPQLEILRHDLPGLTVELPKTSSHLAALGDLLVVATGNRVEAYRLVESSLVEQYRPLFGSLIFTLVVAMVALPVVRLHPRLDG